MPPSTPANGTAPLSPQGADAPRLSGPEKAALGLSAAWLVLGVALFAVYGAAGTDGPLGFLVVALVIFLPVALVWVAVTAARTARAVREESARLYAAIDAIRQTSARQGLAMPAPGGETTVARKPDVTAATPRKAETALATFSSSRPLPSVLPRRRSAPAPTPPGDDAQVALPLGMQAGDMSPPLDRADFIRALNFPETAEDKDGFAALRRALKDRPTAQLVQAAQDVLTLLSQDGIYMDDLRPDMARPEIWRSFAGGARGRAIAALGGIRDRSSLALAAARMKSDPIFRDAAHHFLRRFDQMFSNFADTASDSDISDLSNTRTARAFMLLGRVAGTFD